MIQIKFPNFEREERDNFLDNLKNTFGSKYDIAFYGNTIGDVKFDIRWYYMGHNFWIEIQNENNKELKDLATILKLTWV